MKAVIREASDPLPKFLKNRFKTEINGVPNNWGEALQFRINKQNKIYRAVNPQGSYATGSKG